LHSENDCANIVDQGDASDILANGDDEKAVRNDLSDFLMSTDWMTSTPGIPDKPAAAYVHSRMIARWTMPSIRFDFQIRDKIQGVLNGNSIFINASSFLI
jgi:hypothetical protein